MKSDAVTRDYNSPLREKQTVDTRAAIVEALLEQVTDESLADFSIPKVAERAGVSVRTVYRYFPTREDLLDAVRREFGSSHDLPQPESLEDLPAHTRRLFAHFERNKAGVVAALNTRLGQEAHARSRRPRFKKLQRMIDEATPDLSQAERLGLFAVSRALVSADAWRTMRDAVGAEHVDDATEAASWAIEAVIKEAKKRNARARTAAQKNSPPAAKKRGKKGAKK